MLGFTFMSDVQFMGWMLAALFLYARGLRRGSDALVFLGSIASVGAIGTRQFGVAIVVALLVAWTFSRREGRPGLRIMLLAATLPAAAGVWQIFFSAREPTFTQVMRLSEEGVYLAQPPMVLAHEFLWRAAVVLQYVGISILPALPLLVWVALKCARQSRRTAARLLLLTTLIGLGLCAILLTGSPLTAPPNAGPRRLWPPLGLEWLLKTQLVEHVELLRPIDLVGIGVAAALCAVALLNARGRWPLRRARPDTILLVATPACLLGLHLIYVQLNDTYIVPFVPFALLLLVVQYRGSKLPPRLAAMSSGILLAALLLQSLWIRADFAVQTKLWAAADRLTKAGVEAPAIHSRRTWMEYHGAFDDWLTAGRPGLELRPSTRPGFDSLHDPFYAWLDIRGRYAAYSVQTYPMCEPGWRLIARDSYRDFAFMRREVFTYQAVEATRTVKPEECDS